VELLYSAGFVFFPPSNPEEKKKSICSAYIKSVRKQGGRTARKEVYMAIFEGAGVAIITPFHTDGSIDYDKFAEWKDILPFYKNIQKDGIVLWQAA